MDVNTTSKRFDSKDSDLPSIAVVVPVYKAEKYISECIESILRQTYPHFNLILVDDGSPDKAGVICDEYAAQDGRIQVIHQKNSGVTVARRKGVEATNAAYVTFVDADDELYDDALENLVAGLENGKYDIVLAWLDRSAHSRPECVYTPTQYIRALLLNEVVVGPVAKLIHRELFTSFTFEIPSEIRRGEDKLMNIRLAVENKKEVHQLDKVVYKYRVNEESCMGTFISTPPHKSLFCRYLVQSIPKDVRSVFMSDLIQCRLRTIEEIAADFPRELSGSLDLLTDLRRDVAQTDYPLTLAQRVYLYSRSYLLIRLTCLFQRIVRRLTR